jgi:hypothetical protein
MSVQKKSLISNRPTVKKALIASQSADAAETTPLKASALTAQSMKSKKRNVVSFKAYKKA